MPSAPLVTGGGGRTDTIIPGDARLLATTLGFEYGQVARQAAEAADVPRITGCANGESETACAERFIGTFAHNAFRRLLSADETARLTAIYQTGKDGGTFAEGIRLVIEAVLQAPSFLYVSELGVERADGSFELTPYEVATQLGLLFFDSLPDEGLLAAAESGALGTEAGIAAEVARLATDAEARSRSTWLFDLWFTGSRVLTTAKDEVLFPEFTPELRQSLLESKRRFIDDLTWQGGGTLASLFVSTDLWVDPTMARFLGLDSPSTGGFSRVTSVPERAGILTHPSLLAVLATTKDNSVVHRGLFIYSDLLCTEIPPPPTGALEEGAEVARRLATERERAEYRANSGTCGGCHLQFDPYGLLLERYDVLGRFDAQADARATVAEPEALAGDYDGIVSLTEKLSNAPELGSCAAQQAVSFALARPVTTAPERCLVRDLEARWRTSGLAMNTLLTSLASLPGFQRTRSAAP